jgi:hypothetical protein
MKPWTFMEDLNNWVAVINDTMGKMKINLQMLDEMKERCIF